jgi:hypothetical protein
MGTFSIWHWLVIILLALPVWFFAKAVKKAGYSAWWALLGFVPIVNLVMLWVFAYAKWPSLPER